MALRNPFYRRGGNNPPPDAAPNGATFGLTSSGVSQTVDLKGNDIVTGSLDASKVYRHERLRRGARSAYLAAMGAFVAVALVTGVGKVIDTATENSREANNPRQDVNLEIVEPHVVRADIEVGKDGTYTIMNETLLEKELAGLGVQADAIDGIIKDVAGTNTKDEEHTDIDVSVRGALPNGITFDYTYYQKNEDGVLQRIDDPKAPAAR